MLKKIALRNFQKHKSLEIQLTSGINAIVGPSDSGKTSVMRGLDWIIDNRPQGLASIRHNPVLSGKKKKLPKVDETQSIMETADVVVCRSRNDSDMNQYVVSDREDTIVYEALRGNVPSTVSELLNISKYSRQSQHDLPFIISETPGEVAKKLNELVGLDIIDDTLKNINSIVSDSKRQVASLEKDIDRDLSEIKKLVYIDDAAILLDSILEQESVMAQKYDEAEALYLLIDAHDARQFELVVMKRKLKPVNALVKSLDDSLAKRRTVGADIRYLEWEIDKYDEVVYESEQNQVWADALPRIESLQLALTRMKEIIKESTAIGDLISAYQSSESTMEANQEVYKDVASQYLSAVGSVCPICGSKVSQQHLKKHLENSLCNL